MSFIEAISSVFKHYAVFRGRARRSEYWYFFLFNSLVSTAVSAIGIQEILGIYVLVMLLPGMAVAVRRMHDTDHSGWFLLIPIYSLILLFTEGTAGNNRFGADPKAASGAAAGYAAAKTTTSAGAKSSSPAASSRRRPPNSMASTKATRALKRRMPKPLHMATANASMDSPTAIASNSANPTGNLSISVDCQALLSPKNGIDRKRDQYSR